MAKHRRKDEVMKQKPVGPGKQISKHNRFERLETGEAETVRSKANKIKKKKGVLRERKRAEGVAGDSLLLLGLRFENQRMDPQFIAYHRVCLGLEEREYSIVCLSHSLAARLNRCEIWGKGIWEFLGDKREIGRAHV